MGAYVSTHFFYLGAVLTENLKNDVRHLQDAKMYAYRHARICKAAGTKIHHLKLASDVNESLTAPM